MLAIQKQRFPPPKIMDTQELQNPESAEEYEVHLIKEKHVKLAEPLNVNIYMVK